MRGARVKKLRRQAKKWHEENGYPWSKGTFRAFKKWWTKRGDNQQ